MKPRSGIPLWPFLALLVTGCQSYGPRFDARESDLKTYAEELQNAHFSGVARLDQRSFKPVGLTNQIPTDWLRPPSDFYRLGPGDIIELEILGEPQSRSTALVGPDGKIYYNLLPGIVVWGLTLSEAKDVLERELAKYIRLKPDVGLILKAVGSKRVWILGSVQEPGVYSLAMPMSLLEAISTAGGTLMLPGSSEETADLQRSFVMRDGQLLKVDFYRLLRLGDLSQNIYLQSDDFVYLRSAVSRNVYVLGAVALPNIVPFSEPTTLMGAIASAGGPIPYAQLSKVAIVRGSLSNPSIAVVEYKAILKGQAPDVRLEPGDIVYVPVSPYKTLALFADDVLSQFVRTIAVNEGQNAVIRGASPVGVSVGVGTSVAPPR